MAPPKADGRLAKAGLALLLASAVGFYLEYGPRSPETTALPVLGEADMLGLLREPRPLPDIGFVDGEGRPARLSGTRGKVILLNLWAPWCAPCRKEMPALDRLQASLGGADFEVIALSIDRDGLAAVKAFYRQAGIRNLGAYLDASGQALSQLGVAAIPATLIIDPRGNEIARWMGPAEWDSKALGKLVLRTRN